MSGKLLAVALAAIALVPGAFAQDDEGPYIYSTYFSCDIDKEWLADTIAEQYDAEAFNGAMEDGSISGWGWLVHHTGGQWRRASYYVAPTLDALLDGQEAVDSRRQKQDAPPEAASAFSQACPAHDDYIWQLVSGSQGLELDRERGKAGLSVYHVCNMVDEDRADELIESTMAPLYNAQVKKGNLDSWGWMQHVIGGKYRRLETLTGKDHKSILKARNEIIEQLTAKHEAASDEFTSICGSHSDYMWDIVHEE